MDKPKTDSPSSPPVAVPDPDPRHLAEGKVVVCEIYEAFVDDLSVRSPVQYPAVALANAAADLSATRAWLMDPSVAADPVRLRGQIVATAAYLTRVVVQLGLPAPISLDPPDPEDDQATSPPPRRHSEDRSGRLGPIAGLLFAVAGTSLLLLVISLTPQWVHQAHPSSWLLHLAQFGWLAVAAIQIVGRRGRGTR